MDSFAELAQAVAELSVRVVKPATTWGITLAQDDRVITATTGDALARQLDAQQYEYESEPCLQAVQPPMRYPTPRAGCLTARGARSMRPPREWEA